MTQRIYVSIHVGSIAAAAGVGGVTLSEAGGIGDDGFIVMAERVHVSGLCCMAAGAFSGLFTLIKAGGIGGLRPFAEVMTQRIYVSIHVGSIAAAAGMGGIALIETGGIGDDSFIVMAERVHVSGLRCMAAGAFSGLFALSQAGGFGGYGPFAEVVAQRVYVSIHVGIVAAAAGMGGIALSETGGISDNGNVVMALCGDRFCFRLSADGAGKGLGSGAEAGGFLRYRTGIPAVVCLCGCNGAANRTYLPVLRAVGGPGRTFGMRYRGNRLGIGGAAAAVGTGEGFYALGRAGRLGGHAAAVPRMVRIVRGKDIRNAVRSAVFISCSGEGTVCVGGKGPAGKVLAAGRRGIGDRFRCIIILRKTLLGGGIVPRAAVRNHGERAGVDLPYGVEVQIRISVIRGTGNVVCACGGTAGAPALKGITRAGGRGGTEGEIAVIVLILRSRGARAAVGVIGYFINRFKTEGIAAGDKIAVIRCIVVRFYAEEVFGAGRQLDLLVEIAVGAAHKIVMVVAAVVVRRLIGRGGAVGGILIDDHIRIEGGCGRRTVDQVRAGLGRRVGKIVDLRRRGDVGGMVAVQRKRGGAGGIPQRVIRGGRRGNRDGFRRKILLGLGAGAVCGPRDQVVARPGKPAL